MPRTTLKIVAASAVAAGALVAGGAAMALADDTSSPGPSASASPGTGDPAGKRGGSHTEVTGTEADKVIAAVTAKDSTVTVETVRKDEDGSYDAIGTKDGTKVSFDVSADLATVTERTGGGHGGPGGRGGSHTEVTGTEADKVIAAVTAKDSTVTVETVRKDEDGSYDAIGTKDGAKVSFDVSADLATVTERTGGGPGGHGGHGRGGDSDAGTSTTPSDANTSTSADATATAV